MSERDREGARIPEDASENPAFVDMLQDVFSLQRSRGLLEEPPPVGRDIFQDESDQLFIGREFTLDQFRRWFAVQRLKTQPFNAVGYHHTEVPDQRIWAGLPSLRGVFNFYQNELGWPAGVGPHLWVYSGDGAYSPGLPRIYVGTHPAHDGIGITNRNGRWLHIEHIWNGDTQPFSDALRRVSGQLLGIVCQPHQHAARQIPLRFLRDTGINNPSTPLGIMFHRDQNPVWPRDGGWPKSCPGLKVSHEDLDPSLIAFAQGSVSTAFAKHSNVEVTQSPLNFRDEPGLDGAIVAELEEGDRLVVLNGPVSRDERDWYQVRRQDGTAGWVAGEFCALVS